MNFRFEKVVYIILNICFFPQTSIAQDTTFSDTIEISVNDSLVQNYGNEISSLNLEFNFDSTLAITDTLHTFSAQNQPPVFLKKNFDFTLNEDEELIVPFSLISSHVSDPDDSLTFLLWEVLTSNNIKSTFVNDSIKMIPISNWFGLDTIVVVVADSNSTDTAFLQLNVLPVNDPPVFTSDIPTATLNEDEQKQLLISNWFHFVDDPDDADSLLTLELTDHQNISIKHIGNDFIFTPLDNWFGTETLNVIISDGKSTDSVPFTIKILAVNDQPTFVKKLPEVIFSEDQSINVDFLDWYNFIDDIDNSKHELTWKILGSQAIKITTDKISVTFSSPRNWFGKEQLTVVLSDGSLSDTTFLQIHVLPVNDPPVFTADIPSAIMNEDEEKHLDISNWFGFVKDPDDNDQSLQWSISTSDNFDLKRNDNKIIIIPHQDWNGHDTIDVIVSDGEYTVTSSLIIHILPINDAPVFIKTIPVLTLEEDEVFYLKLSILREYIFDVDNHIDSLKVFLETGKNVSYQQNKEMITLKPTTDWFGSDTLAVKVSDGEVTSTSNLILKIQSINDPPVFASSLPDTFTFEDKELTLPVKRWYPFISDKDHEDEMLEWSILHSKSFKSFYGQGSITLTPFPNWNGYDNIQIIATDGLSSDTSLIKIRTIPVNDPPSITSFPNLVLNEDEMAELDLKTLLYDIDHDINDISWSFISDFPFNKKSSITNFLDPQNSDQKETQNNLFITVIDSIYKAVIKPPENYFAENVSFIVQVSDPMGGIDIKMFNVSVLPINDPPVLDSLPILTFNEDEQFLSSKAVWYPYVNDVDNRDTELIWNIVSNEHAVNHKIDNDSIYFFSENNWFGTDTMILSVNDGEFSDERELIVSVLPMNDPPKPFGLINHTRGDSSKYTFFWFPSVDVEGDKIEYHFHLAGGTLDTTIHKIFNTHFTFYGEEFLEPNIPYSWFVEASDNSDTTASIENFEFVIQFTPRTFAILPNYPNPFNYNTVIPFDIPHESMVKLNVLDINGKIIKNLVHQTKSAGRHQIIWEGRDRYSKPVASGVYLIVMETNGKAFVRKIMYIK